MEAAPAGAGISPEEFVGSVCVSPALYWLPEGLVTKWGHSLGLPEGGAGIFWSTGISRIMGKQGGDALQVVVVVVWSSSSRAELGHLQSTGLGELLGWLQEMEG